MRLDVQPIRSSPRITPEDQARLRAIAAPVARAARILRRDARTGIPKADLEALGMLAVWRKLPAYDSARAHFDRWAFYQAFRAMTDASRDVRQETLFEATLRRTLQGYVALDDRPAERDFLNDARETDVGRLRARTRRAGAAAWLQTILEHEGEGAPVERSVAATEAVRSVREEIAILSDEQRTILRLRFWDDAEVRDVAARMGLSERTLRRRWVETRDLLARRLRARGIFGVPDGFAEAVDALALEQEPSE